MSDPTTWTRDETPKNIYNPLNDDFPCTYRDEDNKEQTIVVPMLIVSTYPTYLADHISKHLVDELINVRGLKTVTPEVRQELQKEVEV